MTQGQFNFCVVIVEPNLHGMNRVFVKTKDERIRSEFLPHLEPACVSDTNVALLARQLALHCAVRGARRGGGRGRARPQRPHTRFVRSWRRRSRSR